MIFHHKVFCKTSIQVYRQAQRVCAQACTKVHTSVQNLHQKHKTEALYVNAHKKEEKKTHKLLMNVIVIDKNIDDLS